MSCNRALSVHLLRGCGAVILLVTAFLFSGEKVWLVPPLLLGAIVVLRGCPVCWLVGLFEVIARRRDAAADSTNS